jgi:hypothetical protein
MTLEKHSLNNMKENSYNKYLIDLLPNRNEPSFYISIIYGHHSRITSGRQLDNSKELFNIPSVREIHDIKRYIFLPMMFSVT